MGSIFEIRLKRVKNLGNYESKAVEAAMQLEENEDAELAMVKLEEYVMSSLHEVKADKVKEVVDGGNVLTKNNEVKDPSSGKTVKKKVAKKKATKKVSKKEDVEVTLEVLTKTLQEVWRKAGKSIAKDILKSFDADKISELKEDQYGEVYKECKKCL